MTVIIDYGAGNLRSVQKAFEFIGENALISSSEKDVFKADRLVLPGNGAYGDCMDGLKQLGLVTAIHKFIETGKPFLGICIGMQLLFDKSFEFGVHEGLGYIKGVVRRFPDDILKRGLKIPHTGWNDLKIVAESPLFRGIETGSFFYFVHSYYAAPSGEEETLALCDYDGPFAAAVAKDNVMGVQFHPEKSQKPGLRLLENFCLI